MDFKEVRSQFVDWDNIDGVLHNGQSGTSVWKEINTGNGRIGLAEYSSNYKSAEWCEKGHIVYCTEGELLILLKNGIEHTLHAGHTLMLNEEDHHIAITGALPAKIFVVD